MIKVLGPKITRHKLLVPDYFTHKIKYLMGIDYFRLIMIHRIYSKIQITGI